MVTVLYENAHMRAELAVITAMTCTAIASGHIRRKCATFIGAAFEVVWRV